MLFEFQVRRTGNFLGTSEKGEKDSGYDITRESIDIFIEINGSNQWLIFKLARMCVRYSYYALTHQLFEGLSRNLANVESGEDNVTIKDLTYISWLEFMSMICKAEHLISQSSVEHVRYGTNSYY